MNDVEEYYKEMAATGKTLKALLSEAQIALGKMEAYFLMIQKKISEVPEKEKP